jgi:hypothetical protein
VVDETQEDQEEVGKKRKIIKTGTGNSPNPWSDYDDNE